MSSNSTTKTSFHHRLKSIVSSNTLSNTLQHINKSISLSFSSLQTIKSAKSARTVKKRTWAWPQEFNGIVQCSSIHLMASTHVNVTNDAIELLQILLSLIQADSISWIRLGSARKNPINSLYIFVLCYRNISKCNHHAEQIKMFSIDQHFLMKLKLHSRRAGKAIENEESQMLILQINISYLSDVWLPSSFFFFLFSLSFETK